jgi:hypothetical protein
MVAEQFSASPEAAWALVGTFDGIADVFQAVEDVELSDSSRTFTMMGMRITEHLVLRDEVTRTLTYSIVEGVPGITAHEATIHVEPAGDGCEVTWSVTTEPPEAAGLFADTYRQALISLRPRLDAA